jgi:hypothetical protein
MRPGTAEINGRRRTVLLFLGQLRVQFITRLPLPSQVLLRHMLRAIPHIRRRRIERACARPSACDRRIGQRLRRAGRAAVAPATGCWGYRGVWLRASRGDGGASRRSWARPAGERRVAVNLNASARWPYSDAMDTSCCDMAALPFASRARLAHVRMSGDEGLRRRQEANT